MRKIERKKNRKKEKEVSKLEIFFIQAWSEEILRFDLYLHIKIHQIARKNSQNAGVNRAKKAYQCVVYTLTRSAIATNPRVYL